MIYERDTVYSLGTVENKNEWRGMHQTNDGEHLVVETTEGVYWFKKVIQGWVVQVAPLDIERYISGAFVNSPVDSIEQLDSMVVLHFDVPDAVARDMVRQSIVPLLERFMRQRRLKEGELRWLNSHIAMLEGAT